MPIQETQDLNLRQFVLDCTSFGPVEINQIAAEMSRNSEKFKDLRDGVNELASKASDLSPSMMVKLGVCQYLMGQYDEALESLKHSDGGALAQFYMAKVHAVKEDNAKAIELYDVAKKAGYDPDRCVLGQASVYLAMGDPHKALALLDRLSGAIEQTADYLSLRGATVAATCENPDEAVNLYERAFKVNPNHSDTLFGLALENERRGNDDEALDFYRRASRIFPTNVGTLMNLGILLEDKELYEEAADCYNRVLAAFPDNKRARLFLKDAQGNSQEDSRGKVSPRGSSHLSTPINDITFSTRVRTVINSIGCKTLGDLARCTRDKLLSYGNFGENSLNEIVKVLEDHELHLGWTDNDNVGVADHEKSPRGGFQQGNLGSNDTPNDEKNAVYELPVSFLELSRRASHGLEKGNIRTIKDLCERTHNDLMNIANFGITSCKEVKEKLWAKYSLRLKGEIKDSETQGK